MSKIQSSHLFINWIKQPTHQNIQSNLFIYWISIFCHVTAFVIHCWALIERFYVRFDHIQWKAEDLKGLLNIEERRRTGSVGGNIIRLAFQDYKFLKFNSILAIIKSFRTPFVFLRPEPFNKITFYQNHFSIVVKKINYSNSSTNLNKY